MSTAALFLAMVLLVIDWQQTLTIAKNPDKWREKNPLIRWQMAKLGPEKGVHTHFMASAAIIMTIACIFQAYQLAWSALWIALEGWVVIHNHKLGIRPAFLD